MIVIFSGYNQRAVVAFLRCLARNHIEDYVIVAASNQDTILKTSYKDKVFCIRKNKELDRKEICNILGTIHKQYAADSLLIPPSTEALNRFLLKYRRILETLQCVIPLVDMTLYETISDKENFWNLCRRNDLAVPPTIVLSKVYTEPYVAKPKHYRAKDGNTYSPILVQTLEEHKNFQSKYDWDDFTYQKYILGDSYYILYYFARDGRVYRFSQENYAQQPNGKSILAAEASDIHEKDIAQKYQELFQKVNYFGFVMVELRENEGEYYMIEANPRFWGPSQLFVDARVPFFEAFLKDYNYISRINESEINYDAKYLWSGGFRDGQSINSQNCVWFGNGRQKVIEEWKEFREMDIYYRSDTMGVFDEERSGNGGK